MRWSRAIRNGSKWACTALAVLLVGVMIWSRWWYFSWTWMDAGPESWQVVAGSGYLAASHHYYMDYPRHGPMIERSLGWVWGWNNLTDPRSDWGYGFSFEHEAKAVAEFRVTIVYPVLLTPLAAALLWRRDLRARRRERVGLCGGCGYDRRGLASGAL